MIQTTTNVGYPKKKVYENYEGMWNAGSVSWTYCSKRCVFRASLKGTSLQQKVLKCEKLQNTILLLNKKNDYWIAPKLIQCIYTMVIIIALA